MTDEDLRAVRKFVKERILDEAKRLEIPFDTTVLLVVRVTNRLTAKEWGDPPGPAPEPVCYFDVPLESICPKHGQFLLECPAVMTRWEEWRDSARAARRLGTWNRDNLTP